MPFLTAGYPNLDVTRALLDDFESRGAHICELGIPFSDPVADGPTIQASYTAALENGITSGKILDMVREYRAAGGEMALVMMVSYSIVFRHGVAEYLKQAAEAGIDGMIIPDLQIGEAGLVSELTASFGLGNIMLIAPTTPTDRRIEIAARSTGFTYYISVSGITGERTKLPPETIAGVAELRKHTETPVCVGFGISNADTVKAVCEVGDGAIVGSAIIHRITDAKDKPLSELVEHVGQFVSELLTGTK